MKRSTAWFNNIKAIYRFFLCLSVALLLSALLYLKHLDWLNNLLISWVVFSGCLIGLSWITFFTTPSAELCTKAQQQDESRYITFVIVLLGVCISFFGIVFVLRENNADLFQKDLHIYFALAGVALSWFLLHTIFTLHYAHLSYTNQHPQQVSGLQFPDDNDPDYLDFAYFSFTIGMTFQVSDVTISSKKIRRFVLLHGLLSFVFNVIIIALTLNILSGNTK